MFVELSAWRDLFRLAGDSEYRINKRGRTSGYTYYEKSSTQSSRVLTIASFRDRLPYVCIWMYVDVVIYAL